MAYKYFPHTEKDIATMLEKIGISSLKELYADVPDSIMFKGEYNIELAKLVRVSDMYADLDENTKFSGLRFATVGAGSDVKFNVTAKGQGFNNVVYTVDTDVYNSAESKHENDAYNGGNDTTLEKPGNDVVEDILKDVEQAQNQER